MDAISITPELESAISSLYRAFRERKLADKLQGCPCCANDSELCRLSTTPLRALGSADLEPYSWHAIWTVGTEDDFRYFVPRLLELMVREGAFQPEVVAKKLRLAGWCAWSAPEQAAIHEYFRAFWSAVFARTFWFIDASSAVCVLGNVFDDLVPFLSVWLSADEPAAVRELVEFSQSEASSAASGFINQPFWDERPDQMKQVADWLTSQETLESVEQRWLANSEGPLAGDLLKITQAITPFVQRNSK